MYHFLENRQIELEGVIADSIKKLVTLDPLSADSTFAEWRVAKLNEELDEVIKHLCMLYDVVYGEGVSSIEDKQRVNDATEYYNKLNIPPSTEVPYRSLE